MARLIGPSEASREVKTIVTTSGVTKGLFKSKALRPATYYTTSAADVLADVLDLDGDPIPDSTVTIDSYSMLPLMQFPDGVDVVYIRVDGGPVWPVYAREDDQIDALEAAVGALQGSVAGAETPAGAQGKVDAHAADTTAVHGIADTAQLETQAGAQTKASAAQTAAAADATTKANAAQSAAISAAAADATTKASAAQSAATAAAAADATTKASAAQAAAISAAATDATTKANAAQAAAVLRVNHTGTQAISTVTGLQTALDAKAGKGASYLSAVDYVTGDGTVDDTAGFISAITTADTFGAALFVPNPAAHYKITAALPVPAGLTITGAGRGCEIRQYTRSPYRPVFDCLNADNVTIHGFTLTLNGGFLSAPGSNIRAENGYTYASAIWTNSSSGTFYDLTVNSFVSAVMFSAWDGTAQSTTVKRTGNTVRDVEIRDSNFGILFMGQDGLRISGLRVYDVPDPTPGGGGPPHAIYGTGTQTLRSRNVTISDCATRNSPAGTAYQVKYTDGLTMTNMQAESCLGIFNGIDINDAGFTNFVSRNDTAQVGASFCTQKVNDQPQRITIDSLTIHKAPDTVGTDRLINLIADDVIMSNINLFPNVSASAGSYTTFIRGMRYKIDGVKIRGVGTGRSHGILVGFAPEYPTGDVTITNLSTSHLRSLVDFDASITGNNTISYDPAAQSDLVPSAGYFNQINGTATFTIARQERVKTYTVAAGAGATPTPAMETVTRLDVTDSTAFTVAAPAGGGVKTGLVQKVVIVNGTSAPIGTITWNAAYALRSALLAPPAGESHSITFMFNGTNWREIERSQTAATPVPNLGSPFKAGGEASFDRRLLRSPSSALTSGAIDLTYFVAAQTETITSLTLATAGTAASGLTLLRYCVYSVAANGDLTLVASTESDTSLLAATFTAYPKPLLASWTKQAGQEYAAGLLPIGTTMPTVLSFDNNGAGIFDTIYATGPRLSARLTSQTDLPANITAGTLSPTRRVPYVEARP